MIRAGTEKDITELLVLAKDFYEVSGYADHVPYDYASCAERFIIAIDQGLCFVCEKDAQIVGFVIGASAPCIFNKNYLMGVELAWWVTPDYRGSTVGIKLLKAIESAAKDRGVKIWSMICLESQEPEKVSDMYSRMDYVATERTFTRFF
jgi:L-amino acid N-acyltransferase YncA